MDDTLYPQISYKRSGFSVVARWLASRLDLCPSAILSELEDIIALYGPSYPYMFDRLAERLTLSNPFIPQMVRIFIEHEPRIRCYNGVIPMLSRLRRKYRLGILTDGRLAIQQKKIVALGLENQVSRVLYSDVLGLEKPAIELFEWFEDVFSIGGTHMMYVGDNPKKDFYGANSRGWISVMVKTGEIRRHTNKSDCEPRIEIPSVTFLEKAIKHSFPKPETSDVGEGIWSII